MVEFTDANDPELEFSFYWYRAQFFSIYDADTIRFDIDLGFGVWLRGQAVRLYGIDAYELRGPEREQGLKAKEHAENRLNSTRAIRLLTYKDRTGKYGRWLAQVFLWIDDEWLNLNQDLVLTEHAKIVDY